jgi:ketosteroid isomerase-like protein
MPVMMISEVVGQTAEGYDGMLACVGPALRQAPGFVAHMAHATETGWRIVEIWQSQQYATRFFAAHIAPNLPPGVRPKLCFQPLHGLVAADGAIDPVVSALVERSAEAHGALMQGDVDRCRALIKYTGDFTLMAPFGGPPSRGEIPEERWEAMKRFFRHGVFEQEVVQTYGSADMVVLVLIERQTVEVGDVPRQDWALRVTLVYRREDGDWRLAHRHADPLAHGITVKQAAALARADAG